jgi:glutamate-ammonia-ligase adenylyltransferase
MSRVRLDTLREEVVSMRARMRRELDRSEAGRFDLKHGRGGIGDIEFVVQYLVLRNARNYPAAYREFRRRLHHLTLNDRPPFVGDDELLAERDLVAAVWERHLGGQVS